MPEVFDMLPNNDPSVISGNFPNALGVTWLSTPDADFANPLLVDRRRLGGIAREDIPSPEYRKLDNRVEAFLKSGRTADKDIVVVDTAEYATPGLDEEFRPIVSVWILTSLITDRLSAHYEMVTKHNLNYRRYYHQFDY